MVSDRFSGVGMLCCVCDVKISNALLETFPSWAVRLHGVVCNLPSVSWTATSRSFANEQSNWALVARFTRRALRPRGLHLRGKTMIHEAEICPNGDLIKQLRIPEKWFPGRHDVWGSSHQIFHVLVVVAAVSHLTGLIQAFDHRHRSLCKSRCPMAGTLLLIIRFAEKRFEQMSTPRKRIC